MKRIALYGLMALFLFFVPLTADSAQPVQVEILYMNHGPLQPILKDLNDLCAMYGKGIIVSRYDFESPEGERFMSRKGIRQHIPLAIWVDGKSTFPLKGKEITFMGFPTGSGPAFFQGKWTIDDLREALDQLTHKK